MKYIIEAIEEKFSSMAAENICLKHQIEELKKQIKAAESKLYADESVAKNEA